MRRLAGVALLFLALASCATHPGPRAATVRASTVVPEMVGLLSLQPGNVEAITVGGTVWVKPESARDSALLQHEMIHVEQWRRHGALLPVLYLLSSVMCWCRINGFEEEARGQQRSD